MFARKKTQAELPDLSEAPAPASEQINPWAQRALAAVGISVEELQAKGAEVKAILDDYRERLQRVESKLDMAGADLAELLEMLRQDKVP